MRNVLLYFIIILWQYEKPLHRLLQSLTSSSFLHRISYNSQYAFVQSRINIAHIHIQKHVAIHNYSIRNIKHTRIVKNPE